MSTVNERGRDRLVEQVLVRGFWKYLMSNKKREKKRKKEKQRSNLVRISTLFASCISFFLFDVSCTL